MHRVNLRLLAVLGLLLVAGGAGVWVLHRYQVHRNAKTMASLADERIAAGQEDEALELLSRYVAMRPDDLDRQRQYAELLLARIDTGRATPRSVALAKGMMERAVRAAPDDDLLREKLADLLLRTGDLSGSYDNYSTILTHLDSPERAAPTDAGEGGGERPERGRITILCAALSAQLGRFDEAESLLSRLIGFDPATKRFATGGKADPRHAAAYPSLARIVEKHRRDPQTAARIMARLTEDLPERVEAAKLLAAWHLEHGELDEADAAVAEARTLDAEDTDATFLELQIAMARKDDRRAEALLDGPLAALAQTPAVVVNRASLLQRRGDVEGRVRVLREALEANPAQPLFRAELILAMAEAKKHDELRDLIAESRPLLPPDAEVLIYGDAVIEMADQHWLQALKLLEKLRPLVATDAAFTRRVDLALSTCHGALGQLDQAADARSRALENVPGSRVARFAEMQTLEQTGRSAEALAIAEALAGELGPERLVGVRELWLPLFRLRVLAQMRRPAAERDWSEVDALLAGVATAPEQDPILLERLRIDLVAAKQDSDAALAASAAALASHPGAEPLLAQRVMLLASAGKVVESRELLAGLPEAARDSADVIEAEVRLAAVSPREEAAGWLEDVAARMDRLADADADRVAKQLIAIHVARGSSADAEQIARRSLARNKEHLPVLLVLLDLVADRNDVAAVDEQVAAIWRIAGRESATGRYAEAIQRIVAVRAGRKGSAGDTPALDGEATASLGLARGLLVEAARDRPRWGDVPRAMAAIAELQGDKSAAIGSLRQAVELGEVLPFGRRRLALLLASSGRLEEAVPVIVSLGDAGGPAVDRLRAEAMAIAGRTADALSIAASLTPEDCTDPDQLLWYASLLARCQAPEEAQLACRRAIAAAPTRPLPRATLVGIQASAGDTAAAEATAAEAVAALEGADRERFESLVDGLIGDPEAIEKRCRDAVAKAPDDPAAARRLAEALLRRQKRAAAVEELRRLVAMPTAEGTPTLVWARRALGAQLAATGLYRDFAEALALLEANVDGDGKQFSEDVASSILLLVNRDEPSSWRRSFTLFEELAKRRPLTVDERVGLARIQSRLGQRAKARDELAAIASSPNSSIGVVTSLVELLLEDGDTRGAARWVARLEETVPGSPSTIRLQAKLALAEGRRDRAAELAATLIPAEPVTAVNAARLLQGAKLAEELGFPEAGDRVLGEYATLSPAGAVLRASSLGRRQRTAEAIESVAAAAGRVSPMAFLDAVTTIVRHATDDLSAESLARIEEWIARARRENPGAAEVAIQAAILEDALGRSEDAERSYRALLADESLSPVQRGVVAANLAWILARPETADEAAELVDRAVQTLGPLPDVLDTRALVRLAKGQTNLALDDMREAVIVPTALKYLHLAAAHVAASDLEAARVAFARSKALGLGKERLDERDARRIESLESTLAAQGGKS